ncbi:hypothetical protein V8D89_002576 [Ganoderma adspersum]
MLHTLPDKFPELPPHPTGDTWSSVIYEAHGVLSTAYHDSAALLHFEDGNPIRLHLHATQILKQKVPILQALEQEVSNPAWITSCTEALGILARELLDEAANTDAILESNLVKSLPLHKVKTGPRGRPRIDATSSHHCIPLTAIADALHIHHNTLRNKMRHYNLDRKFSDISDEDLEKLVCAFKLMKPNSGLRYVMGFLKGNSLRVQKARALRNHAAIDRREYTMPMLRANTNNQASTVLVLFLKAVEEWGMPSRVRGDCGRENLEVAVWMTKYHSVGRASFMWGSSTRNTKIECMWHHHQLDPSNPAHLWLLHLLFLDALNSDCDDFRTQWNHHPISGKGKDRSPLCIFDTLILIKTARISASLGSSNKKLLTMIS